jgi:lipopolysaccharide biosynthesis protein
LQNHKVAAYLHFVENKGRDIAPFISILPILKKHGISTVLKLHTKRSVHLHHSSSNWLSDLLHQLVAEQKLEKHFNYLKTHSHIGMIVPYGHLLPLAFYYGENTILMLQLAAKWNINSSLFGSAIFSAGSMFFARISALHQLMNFDETEQNFESENGQLDGTLAHAIERMFCMLCTSNGYSIVDTENLETTISYTVFTDHRQTR